MKGFLFAWNIALTIALVVLWFGSAEAARGNESDIEGIKEKVEANSMNINNAIDAAKENKAEIYWTDKKQSEIIELINQHADIINQHGDALNSQRDAIIAVGEYLEAKEQQTGELNIEDFIKLMQLLGYL